MIRLPRLRVEFFGSEDHYPVRKWLLGLDAAIRREIGADIQAIQWRWPVSKPLVDGLGNGFMEFVHRWMGVFFWFYSAFTGMLCMVLRKIAENIEESTGLGQTAKGDCTMKPIDELEAMFEETGEQDQVRALSAKKIIAADLKDLMTSRGVSKSSLARQMHTARPVVDRLLDPHNTGVTLKTIAKAASVLGGTIRLQV